jgi:ribosomal protein L10
MPRIGIAQDRQRQEPRAEFIRRSEMALNLSQKQNVVAEVAEVAAKAHSLIAAEYAGTTVSQMTAMRKKARETGVYLKVVKNTLAARAVEGTDFAVAKDSLVGPLLYAFSTEEPGAAGRLIKEFAKGNDKLQAKVVVVEGQQYPAQRTSKCWPRCRPASRRSPCWPACCPNRPHVRPRRQGRGRQAGWRRCPGGSRGRRGRTGLIRVRPDNVSHSIESHPEVIKCPCPTSRSSTPSPPSR